MPAPKVRGDYDELSRIQKLFMQQTQANSASPHKIQSAKVVLQGGDWIGQGRAGIAVEPRSDLWVGSLARDAGHRRADAARVAEYTLQAMIRAPLVLGDYQDLAMNLQMVWSTNELKARGTLAP